MHKAWPVQEQLAFHMNKLKKTYKERLVLPPALNSRTAMWRA